MTDRTRAVLDTNVFVSAALSKNPTSPTREIIVTYDPHFDSLGGEYHGIKIVKAIPFLEVLRSKASQT